MAEYKWDYKNCIELFFKSNGYDLFISILNETITRHFTYGTLFLYTMTNYIIVFKKYWWRFFFFLLMCTFLLDNIRTIINLINSLSCFLKQISLAN